MRLNLASCFKNDIHPGAQMKLYIKILTSTFIGIFSLQSLAITTAVKALINFETKSNGAAKRSNKVIRLPHLEIPLEHVGTDFALRIDPLIVQSLIIELDGQKYVRWILNPEDTKWGDDLINYFKEEKRINLAKHFYFNGYQTASRSYIAEDPVSGIQFSVKSSTNKTGGLWNDKKQPVGDAVDSRIISDFLYEQNKRSSFKNFVIMDEPAMLGITKIDQAVVIRDLGAVRKYNSKFIYLSGFSALHEETGRKIALLNGAVDPARFWTENYIKLVGRALGELAARTGLQFDSPHSQNFLIELSLNMKPTGRIILRDMADFYIDENFFVALEGKDSPTLKRFTQKGNIIKYIAAGFRPLHGNVYPTWITPQRYTSWQKIFFTEFERSFKEISGIDLAVLNVKKCKNKECFSASYNVAKNRHFDGLFDQLANQGYVSSDQTKVNKCSNLLSSVDTHSK